MGTAMTWETFLVVLLLIVAASAVSWCVGYGLACLVVRGLGHF